MNQRFSSISSSDKMTSISSDLMNFQYESNKFSKNDVDTNNATMKNLLEQNDLEKYSSVEDFLKVFFF